MTATTTAIALGAVALAIAACGSGEVTSPAPTEAPSTSPAAPATTAPPATSTPVTTTPVTTGTTAATTSTTVGGTEGPSPAAVLSPDGIGPHRFGTPRSVVEDWLTHELGPPQVEEDASHLFSVCALWGCTQAVLVSWPAAGLRVGFADSPDSDVAPGEAVLAAWAVSTGDWWPGQVNVPAVASAPSDLPPVRLATSGGVRLGSTVAELSTAFPSVEFLAWNDSTFVPIGFYVPGDRLDVPALDGDLDWPSATDIQIALNAAGADLVVDGVPGPSTRAALAEFRLTRQDAGWAEVFAELGLGSPPPTATVTRLGAGQWWWELECGALEGAGLASDC